MVAEVASRSSFRRKKVNDALVRARLRRRAAARGLKQSATLAISEHSNALRKEGRRIYKMGLGQSPFPVPTEVVDALTLHAHEKDYLPVTGLPALREAVAELNLPNRRAGNAQPVMPL